MLSDSIWKDSNSFENDVEKAKNDGHARNMKKEVVDAVQC